MLTTEEEYNMEQNGTAIAITKTARSN